ncbi:MAG: HTH domain-containing protein [Candidatus Helarchaeota archaeon]
MSANNIKDNILKSLKETNFGKSIKKIAEELDLSRTTVSKYLRILEKENKCISKKVGVYSLWFSKENEDLLKQNPYRILIRNFYKSLINSLNKIYPDINERGKEIGINIAEILNIEEFLDIESLYEYLKEDDKRGILKTICDLFLNANILGEDYNFEMIILENENRGIIKLKDTEFTEYPLHFYIQAGVLEGKINKNSPFNVDVQIYEINKEENYCIIIITLKPNKIS